MLKKHIKHIYFAIGWLATGLGVIGAFLPVMPTTPFLIVAVWAFSRSSPRLKNWLYHHPHYGEAIRNWFEHGAVGVRVKIFAIITMSLSIPLVYVLTNNLLIASIQACILVLAAAFLISRPSTGGSAL